MFNPMGMIVGLLVAQQRNAKDPIVPALIGGALPMPIGLIASMLLVGDQTDQAATGTAAPASKRTFDQQLGDAVTRMESARQATNPDPQRIIAAQRQLTALVLAALELPPERQATLTNLQKARALLAKVFSGFEPSPGHRGASVGGGT